MKSLKKWYVFFEGIYIKEKINKNESKIIIASKGQLYKNNNEGFKFKLIDGNITNLDNKGSINLKFEESVYELSNINSKTRKVDRSEEHTS